MVRVGLGINEGVQTDVGDMPLIQPPDVTETKIYGLEVGVRVSVAVGDVKDDKKATEVSVNVALATTLSWPLTGMSREGVGLKKRSAKASLVRARSRGVGVAEYLGTRTISPCVSGLPPAIMTGKLKARTQAPIKTSRTITPCDFN